MGTFIADERDMRIVRPLVLLVFLSSMTGVLAACSGVTTTAERADAAPAPSSSQTATAADGGVRSTGDGGYGKPDGAGACWLDRPTAILPLPGAVTKPSSPGIRVTFRLENHRLVVVGMREDGVAPAWISRDTQIFEEGKTSGFWIEVREKSGALLFQRNAHDPLGKRIEVPGGPGPDSGFQNLEQCPKEGTEFFLSIPNDPGATEIRLYSDPLSGPPSAASLVGWFSAN